MILIWLYGMKHSVDVDHVLALSLLGRSKVMWLWAVGHSVTATIITFTLYSIPVVLPNIKAIVGASLIALGVWSLFTHKHEHKHKELTHKHRHFYKHHVGVGLGIMHGFASNEELLATIMIIYRSLSLFSLIAGLAVYIAGFFFATFLTIRALTRILRKLLVIVPPLSIIWGLVMVLEIPVPI